MRKEQIKKEFLAAFKVTKMIIFEVNYYTLSTNKRAHFTTQANEFIRSKRDWARCGQAQEHILPKNSAAYKFYKKWDEKHLNDLTIEEYQEMINDLEELKAKYKHIYSELDETKKPYNPHISFYSLKKLSMQE